MNADAQSALIVEQRDTVMWLTINREDRRNANSPRVLAGMSDALARANSNRDCRAVVITGAGTRAFCAGADLKSGDSFEFDYSEPYMGFANLFRQAKQSTVPLIARINGACMAGRGHGNYGHVRPGRRQRQGNLWFARGLAPKSSGVVRRNS